MGSTGSQVKAKVKLWCLPGGVEWNKWGGLRNTVEVGKPPPSGGGGTVVCTAGATLALQVCLGQGGAKEKNHKNKRGMET